MVINATNGKGSSLEIPLNFDLLGYGSMHGGTVDASRLTHGVKLFAAAMGSKKRILKTGSGDDILAVGAGLAGGAAGSAVNGGTGDNTYRFANDSSNNYSVHGFDSGDKIQVKTTWVSLSVYDNESDVVAGAGNR